MLIGYARVSKADGSQLLDLQRDALIDAGIAADRIYEDRVSSRKDYRPGLEACLKALQPGNTLTVWKLDRLGRDLRHLVAMVDDLRSREVGLKVLAGAGAEIDTTTPNGRMVFGILQPWRNSSANLSPSGQGPAWRWPGRGAARGDVRGKWTGRRCAWR